METVFLFRFIEAAHHQRRKNKAKIRVSLAIKYKYYARQLYFNVQLYTVGGHNYFTKMAAIS